MTLIHEDVRVHRVRVVLCALAVCLELLPGRGHAQQIVPQTASQETTAQKIQQLTVAVASAQAQLESSEKQIQELRRQLAALQDQLAASAKSDTEQSMSPSALTATTNTKLAQEVDALHEQQAMQQSQIATHEQSKVESESKYPVSITGLILLNGFVNTKASDVIQAPTLAVDGQGSTGASLRQTVLGLDARGPHLFGATSRADVRVDFFGGTSAQGGYNNAGGVLRLRTVHVAMNWKNTEAFVEFDRPIVNPNTPTSLTAVATPALAWSGNLWSWRPQIGISQSFVIGTSSRVKMQAALIDVGDPSIPGSTSTANASLAERSRWPGSEARIALAGAKDDTSPEFGFGGYFSPHRTSGGTRFNSWAGTMDFRLPLPARLELSGSFYRGQALGGLGGGGYKDYIYNPEGTGESIRPLDDVGGWTQLKRRIGERLEFDADFGMDNVFASELRPYYDDPASNLTYQNLARNKTFFTNVIYSPSAYLLFSLEYRRIQTSPVVGSSEDGNVFGLAAGYKF
ncbi:MAG: hypothetical protein ABI177_10635 [Edaphobacter sp.]